MSNGVQHIIKLGANLKIEMVIKHIELLTRQLQQIEQIGKNPETIKDGTYGVEAWKSSTISILERIFGTKSRKIQEIEKIRLGQSVTYSGQPRYYTETVKEQAKAIIEACIAELEMLGESEPNFGNGKGINLTVLQSQDNKQTISLDIIVSELRNELTGNQLDQIQSILDSQETEVYKKKTVTEKLKGFGINTLSNIIAGILTNPNIYTG